jgi:hypothetical protein
VESIFIASSIVHANHHPKSNLGFLAKTTGNGSHRVKAD